ncbi:MAG: hypothetical protein H6Q49_318 [Deltaproteobacteria bacterium]|jgi:hypothetical protein|nr:hypothetical protein [Deltaproteobacteria bacterium]
MKQFKYLAIIFLITFGLSPVTVFSTGDAEQLVLGNHILTLQWLQNHNGLGKAKIFRKDGKILLEGYQEENYEGNLNFMTINGTIKVISPAELEFEGKIVTRINYINNGIPHERKGKFILKAWGGRKYWRMQKMTQPDGEHTVTDYIDIFFEKYQK